MYRNKNTKTQLSTDELYKLFGVTRSSTEKDLSKAFKKLVLKYHPDVNSGEDANARFVELKEQYEQLLAYHLNSKINFSGYSTSTAGKKHSTKGKPNFFDEDDDEDDVIFAEADDDDSAQNDQFDYHSYQKGAQSRYANSNGGFNRIVNSKFLVEQNIIKARDNILSSYIHGDDLFLTFSFGIQQFDYRTKKIVKETPTRISNNISAFPLFVFQTDMMYKGEMEEVVVLIDNTKLQIRNKSFNIIRDIDAFDYEPTSAILSNNGKSLFVTDRHCIYHYDINNNDLRRMMISAPLQHICSTDYGNVLLTADRYRLSLVDADLGVLINEFVFDKVSTKISSIAIVSDLVVAITSYRDFYLYDMEREEIIYRNNLNMYLAQNTIEKVAERYEKKCWTVHGDKLIYIDEHCFLNIFNMKTGTREERLDLAFSKQYMSINSNSITDMFFDHSGDTLFIISGSVVRNFRWSNVDIGVGA